MIIQGDNGTRLRLHINENNVPVDLTGANISVKISAGLKNVYIKTAQVTDLGICEVELSSDNVTDTGKYAIQVTVNFSDGEVYSSDIQTFNVGRKL